MLPALLLTSAASLAGLSVLWLDARGRRPVRGGPFDQIVVAGCRVMEDGRPSTALERRVRLAVDLWSAGHAPRIVFTGGLGGAPISEAAASAALARALGVPGEAIVEEDASTSTWENAAFAARVAPARRVLVVSDAYHVWRCERMFAAHFPEVVGAGAPVPRGVRWRMGLRELALIGYYRAFRRI
jgi:uncharacterized SAM-binding protein YcdF (DUF218 family)